MEWQVLTGVLGFCLVPALLDRCVGGLVEGITVLGGTENEGPTRSQIDFPAFCVLTKGRFLRRFDGTSRTLPIIGGEAFLKLCADPSQFHVTVSITGSYENNTAHLYLTVKDGTRIVKASLRQNRNFKYHSYNDGGYDCLSMAGVQTVVRNFGESLVIETGFASIIVNRELKLESYMVQNPRSPLCGTCGHVNDMTEVCALSPKEDHHPEAVESRVEDPGEKNVTLDHHGDGEYLWSYDPHEKHGPDHWHKVHPAHFACDMTRTFSRQSPINIETRNTKLDPAAPIPRYKVTEVTEGHPQGKLFNIGHAPVLVPVNTTYILENVPFCLEQYRLLGVNVRFGPNADSGSEHRVNGKQYAGEIQIVHFNTRYQGLVEATKHSDGLVVVAILLEVSDGLTGPPINEELSKALLHLPHISNRDQEEFFSVDLSKVLPTPSDLSSYYTYDGSLTIPDCNEIVRWVVLSQPWGISEAQLSAMRLLRVGGSESEPIGVHGNYRQVAPLNQRTVVRRENSV